MHPLFIPSRSNSPPSRASRVISSTPPRIVPTSSSDHRSAISRRPRGLLLASSVHCGSMSSASRHQSIPSARSLARSYRTRRSNVSRGLSFPTSARTTRRNARRRRISRRQMEFVVIARWCSTSISDVVREPRAARRAARARANTRPRRRSRVSRSTETGDEDDARDRSEAVLGTLSRGALSRGMPAVRR